MARAKPQEFLQNQDRHQLSSLTNIGPFHNYLFFNIPVALTFYFILFYEVALMTKCGTFILK